jgi:hypothetical protein
MPTVLSFQSAMDTITTASKKHLLLGNGFSIALKPDIFSYGSLYENADFSKSSHIPKIFEALNTRDFELVIRGLQDTANILGIYDSQFKGSGAKGAR